VRDEEILTERSVVPAVAAGLVHAVRPDSPAFE
jgi:hypothetical protein